ITYAKQPHLNNVYTVFGKYDVEYSHLIPPVIQNVDAKFRPLKDIVLRNVTIHANPIADFK
ncbi:hypothetical protein DYB34_006213, partial [Aphanomyces astaci]